MDDYEAEFVRADGSRFWALVSSTATTFDDEDVRLSWLYDISNRKAAEVAAQQNEILLDRVFEATPVLRVGGRDSGAA